MNHSIQAASRGAVYRSLALAAAALVLGGPVPSAYAATQPVTTMATLLDRVQIEDLLDDYYAQLGSGHAYGTYYTQDGILDVNGIVAQGRKAIDELYARIEHPGLKSPVPRGTFHMLMTNPRIVVNGDTATADDIWTGIICDVVTGPPRFVEQGRERDELVKIDGRWYFKHRIIISDAGLTSMFFKTYTKR